MGVESIVDTVGGEVSLGDWEHDSVGEEAGGSNLAVDIVGRKAPKSNSGHDEYSAVNTVMQATALSQVALYSIIVFFITMLVRLLWFLGI